VGAPLKAALDATKRRSPIILTNLDGQPWMVRLLIRQGLQTARILGLTFNDLRGSAVTRFALAGCTEAQIATITGHSLRDVRSILYNNNYLHRDPALGEAAIRNLEAAHENKKA
jgi:hypothetical protein